MKNKITYIFILIIFLSVSVLLSTETDERIHLVHADKLEQIKIKNEVIKKVSGNVLFRKGEVDLVCELAYWYDYKEQIDFFHNVKVTKEKIKLTADSLTYLYQDELIIANGSPILNDSGRVINAEQLKYYLEDDIAIAENNVKYFEEEKELISDHLIYYTDSGKLVATKNASFIDKKEKNILMADSLIYFNDEKKLVALLEPVLVKNDSVGKETYRISGDIIRGDQTSSSFICQNNVVITQNDFSANAGQAEYNDSTGTVILLDNPVILNDKRTISGKKIIASLPEGKLESVFVDGNALAISVSTAFLPISNEDTLTIIRDSVSVRDEMSGKYMEIYFKENSTDSICISGMATSYYNILEDSIIQGVNAASGDTIIMDFADKQLNIISIIGGTKGQFIPHETNTNMDTTVLYSAQKIDYFLGDRKTNLTENASAKFGDAELTAGKISVLWNKNLLYAYPLDTLSNDSTRNDMPRLVQRGRDPFTGKQLVYNIKTRRGRIIQGMTHMDDGFYYGKDIKMADKKTFYIKTGRFTTCDKTENPHFCFKGNQMKMIRGDKIITKPIVLYIHDIPIIGLPFAVLPNKAGKRRDGWIMPTYGSNANVGGYLRGLGYFWALNDYSDLKITSDFFDKKGIRFNSKTRYKLRYKFDGNISASFHNMMLKDYPEKIWRVSFNHNQKINPSSSFRANGSFVSNDQYMRTNGLDLNDRLDQQLISNATYSKRWQGKPYSLSINMSQTTNLQAKTNINIAPTNNNQRISYVNRSMPGISFSRSSKPLVPLKSTQSASDSKWYNNIYVSLNSRLKNKQDVYYMSEVDPDSAEQYLWQENNELKNAITHGISLNSSQKVSFFSINQNMSFNEDWIFEYDKPVLDEYGNYTIENNRVKTATYQGFLPRHTGSASLGVNTKIYGLFPIKIGGLKSLRHVVTPSIQMSYRPDFTKEIAGWDPGYVETRTDTAGEEWRYDPFASTLIGSTPSGEQKSMRFSLSNIFQAKVDKDGEEKKLDLFTMNFSTSNNLAADSLNWSPIRTSIRTQLAKKLSLNFSMSHDLYKYENRRINEWNATYHNIPIPRLTSMSASTGFSLSSKDFVQNSAPTVEDSLESDTDPLNIVNPSFDNTNQTSGSGSGLWSASMSFRYNLSQNNPEYKNETFSMSLNANIKLTENWKIGYRANVDLMNKKLLSQNIHIDRDLHCWQLSFNWVPSGYGKQFSLMINVKSPMLKDLKYEEKGGRQRGYGF